MDSLVAVAEERSRERLSANPSLSLRPQPWTRSHPLSLSFTAAEEPHRGLTCHVRQSEPAPSRCRPALSRLSRFAAFRQACRTLCAMFAISKVHKLEIAIAISTAFFVVEIVVGFRQNSLVLIADAFHVVSGAYNPPILLYQPS